MPKLILFIFFLLFEVIVCELNIELTSLHMDPNLRRLCWKQFSEESASNILKLNRKSVIGEKQKDSNDMYCIERQDPFEKDLEINMSSNALFLLNINFVLPLAPALPVIRKKIVYDGVHFQMDNNFVGLSPTTRTECQLVLTYKTKQNGNRLIYFTLNSSFPITKIRFDEPFEGIPFKVYYSCKFISVYSTSSSFVMDQGSIYASQNVTPLEPVIELPFRQIFTVRWNHPNYYPEAYVVAVYELDETFREKCLKVFRLFSEKIRGQNESSKSKPIIPKNCDQSVPIEDLGYYKNKAQWNFFIVLNMDVPLKFNSRHKLFISWQHSTSPPENNFIYFEPLPNLNSGKLNIKAYITNSTNYYSFLGSSNPLLQDEVGEYPLTIFGKDVYINGSNSFIAVSGNGGNFYGLTYLSASCAKPDERCINKKDWETNSLYPFFYLLFARNNFNEIFPLTKIESFSSKVQELEFKANKHNSTFFVSWKIAPYSTVQSFYVVEVIRLTSKELSMAYILKCKTCSGMQKQVAEIELSKLRENLSPNKVFENYYEAVDDKISFTTNEMIPELLYVAKVYSYFFTNISHSKESTPGFIRLSFWNLHGTVIISIISIVCIVGIFIGIIFWCRNLFVHGSKQMDNEDSNKYYGEDDV